MIPKLHHFFYYCWITHCQVPGQLIPFQGQINHFKIKPTRYRVKPTRYQVKLLKLFFCQLHVTFQFELFLIMTNLKFSNCFFSWLILRIFDFIFFLPLITCSIYQNFHLIFISLNWYKEIYKDFLFDLVSSLNLVLYLLRFSLLF